MKSLLRVARRRLEAVAEAVLRRRRHERRGARRARSRGVEPVRVAPQLQGQRYFICRGEVGLREAPERGVEVVDRVRLFAE